jgi:hypothetical protein
MTMTYKITFADLGWYEVKAENRKEAEEVALFAARNFHPELPAEKLKIEKTEVLYNG